MSSVQSHCKKKGKEWKMFKWISLFVLVVTLVSPVFAQNTLPAKKVVPSEGYDIHVVAPHVIDGKVMGPFHHYCKVLSPEPVIECLIYLSTEPNAHLVEIEYIVAKNITRETVPLEEWNKNWHDHKEEIATGRVAVLDLPSDKAKEVADLVATTDGIIFHLWPHDSKLPNGKVLIGQAVGHVNLKPEEYKQPAKK